MYILVEIVRFFLTFTLGLVIGATILFAWDRLTQ